MKMIVKTAMIIIQTMEKMVMGKITVVAIVEIIKNHPEKQNKEDPVKI